MTTQADIEDNRAGLAPSGIRSYKPDPETVDANNGVIFNAIPSRIFRDRKVFIETSREGVPGHWVREVVNATGMRATFVGILNVSSSNLSRVYRKKALSKVESEEFLDAVRVLRLAQKVWESGEKARQWLNSPVQALGGQAPIELFDTFEGRRWVSQVLNKIEYGEFS